MAITRMSAETHVYNTTDVEADLGSNSCTLTDDERTDWDQLPPPKSVISGGFTDTQEVILTTKSSALNKSLATFTGMVDFHLCKLEVIKFLCPVCKCQNLFKINLVKL